MKATPVVLHVVPVIDLLDDVLDLHLGQGVVGEGLLGLLDNLSCCAARTALAKV